MTIDESSVVTSRRRISGIVRSATRALTRRSRRRRSGSSRGVDPITAFAGGPLSSGVARAPHRAAAVVEVGLHHADDLRWGDADDVAEVHVAARQALVDA